MGLEVIKERIKEIMVERPGITIQEIADQIGMNRKTAGAYVRTIRAEWKGKE